jgi:lysophospholipase L1-like esterase
MSTVYDKTDNYALNLYGDNDPADLRDGYNGSMRTIDDTLEAHLNRIEGVEARETHDGEVIKALLDDNTVDNATTAKTKWNKAGLDAITAIGKADANKGVLTALGADNADNAVVEKTKWDNAATKANALEPRVQALEPRVQALEPKVQALESRGRTQRNIVVLGDSWTVVHNNALYNRLKNVMPYAVWHNYGISGAVIQQLPEEIEKAKKDASLHPESVTDVIIVMGTNNVFWTNLNGYADITENAAYIAFKTVRDYFTYADIRFFPNNSKTLNDGRNKLYGNIISGAKRAGVATHEESLILLCGHIDWFNGDDQEGVQHLSDDGYRMLADRIANVLQGGVLYLDGVIGSKAGIAYKYTNPGQSNEVDDDTLQIYAFNNTAGLHAIGWMGDPKAVFIYDSNQQVRAEIRGKISITNPSGDFSGEAFFFIGCPNWYKRISKHTLPYVFLSSDTYGYYQSSFISGFDQGFMCKIESKEGGVVDYRSFYFKIPNPVTKNGKTIRLVAAGCSTSIMGESN